MLCGEGEIRSKQRGVGGTYVRWDERSPGLLLTLTRSRNHQQKPAIMPHTRRLRYKFQKYFEWQYFTCEINNLRSQIRANSFACRGHMEEWEKHGDMLECETYTGGISTHLWGYRWHLTRTLLAAHILMSDSSRTGCPWTARTMTSFYSSCQLQ